MGHLKVRELTLRTYLVVIFAILLILIVISWISYRFVKPFPPKTLIMATGMEGGSYAAFGERYKRLLARNGIHVVLRPTSSASAGQTNPAGATFTPMPHTSRRCLNSSQSLI